MTNGRPSSRLTPANKFPDPAPNSGAGGVYLLGQLSPSGRPANLRSGNWRPTR